MRCPACGIEIEEDSEVCECGLRLSGLDEEQKKIIRKRSNKASRNKTLGFISYILGLIVFSAIGQELGKSYPLTVGIAGVLILVGLAVFKKKKKTEE